MTEAQGISFAHSGLERLFAVMDTPAFALNPQGTVVAGNHRFYALCGRPDSLISGIPFQALLPAAPAPEDGAWVHLNDGRQLQMVTLHDAPGSTVFVLTEPVPRPA